MRISISKEPANLYEKELAGKEQFVNNLFTKAKMKAAIAKRIESGTIPDTLTYDLDKAMRLAFKGPGGYAFFWPKGIIGNNKTALVLEVSGLGPPISWNLKPYNDNYYKAYDYTFEWPTPKKRVKK